MAAPKSADEIKSEIFEWLKGTKYVSISLEPLSGGNANFIYRAQLSTPLEDGMTNVLIKHGEGYMAVAPANKISIDRCVRPWRLFAEINWLTSCLKQIEAECLRELGDFCVTSDEADLFKYIIRMPKCYLYDDATHTQIQEYLPHGINLKTYILENFPSSTPKSLRPQCHQLGKALAQYVAGLNDKTDPKLYAELKRNKEMQNLKHMINYDWLIERIDQFPTILEEAREVFVNVKKQALEESKRSPEDLAPVHGDLWPGKWVPALLQNSLVKNAKHRYSILIPNAPIQEGIEIPIFVIDWEQAQLGVPALDHGEMIGELYSFWLYKKIDAGLWMMQGYAEGLGEQSETAVWRNAIQVGVHLLAFSTIAGWGTPDQIEDVARLARDIIVNGMAKNLGWFEKSELACLFTQV